MMLYETSGNEEWLARAISWGDHALRLQADDGRFYLINDVYYNTDLAPDELRALVFLYQATGRQDFLDAAKRYADWHLKMQLPNGGWFLTYDRDGNLVSEYVGPGDMPNLAISFLRLHMATKERKYLDCAIRAIKYAMSQQATPDSKHPFLDDPNVLWGYWPWDPCYDYTMSGDQATHFARGMMYMVDYLASLDIGPE
jgi:hypothetical protein